MKIEYLERPAGPVLRLFDFSENEAREFKQLLDQMVDGKVKSVALHEHCNINPQDNCHLTFFVANKDKGIKLKGKEFECALTKSSLGGISELVGSFAFAPAEGYQWLNQTSDISLLIAPDKRW